jgi:hypothetical protein
MIQRSGGPRGGRNKNVSKLAKPPSIDKYDRRVSPLRLSFRGRCKAGLRHDRSADAVMKLPAGDRLLHSLVSDVALVPLGLNGNTARSAGRRAEHIDAKVSDMGSVVDCESMAAKRRSDPRLELPSVHSIEIL